MNCRKVCLIHQNLQHIAKSITKYIVVIVMTHFDCSELRVIVRVYNHVYSNTVTIILLTIKIRKMYND